MPHAQRQMTLLSQSQNLFYLTLDTDFPIAWPLISGSQPQAVQEEVYDSGEETSIDIHICLGQPDSSHRNGHNRLSVSLLH